MRAEDSQAGLVTGSQSNPSFWMANSSMSSFYSTPPKKKQKTEGPNTDDQVLNVRQSRNMDIQVNPAVSATMVSPDEQGRSTNTSLKGQMPTPSNEGQADIPEEQRRTLHP